MTGESSFIRKLETPCLNQFLWVMAAGLLGLFISAVFSGVLRLPRTLFIVPYLLLVGPFLYAFIRWNKIDLLEQARRQWMWGLTGALVVAAFTVSNILSEPASARPQGASLLFNLIWLGVVYGALDALLLSVMPILATRQAFSGLSRTNGWPICLAVGGISLAASLFVTIAYHFGYPEFRGSEIIAPIIGNAVFSLSYLLTSNPLAPVVSHVVMHVAAVLHGFATTVQLPPHY